MFKDTFSEKNSCAKQRARAVMGPGPYGPGPICVHMGQPIFWYLPIWARAHIGKQHINANKDEYKYIKIRKHAYAIDLNACNMNVNVLKRI